MIQQAVSVPVGSVTTWLSGGTPDRANAAYWAGSVPWISAATLKKARIYDSNQRITESAVRAGSKLAPQGATLVLVRGMALHREVRAGLAMRPVSFNQDVKALIPRPGLVPLYLTYSLHAQQPRILELVSLAGSGTGVLDTDLLKRLPIWLPDRREQEKIVEAIEDADSTVEALEGLIAKKETIMRGMMQQILTSRTRFPGFTEPLAVGALGDIADVVMGQSPAGTSYNRDGAGFPLINGPTEFTDHHPVARQWTTSPVRFCEPGDVLICVRGSSTGRMNIADRRYCIGRGVAAVRARGENDQNYSRYALAALVEHLLRLQSGSTFPSIDSRVIKGGGIDLPEPSEQNVIGQTIADADDQISLLQVRMEKARAVKQGMMQQLLTGHTRLTVQEVPA